MTLTATARTASRGRPHVPWVTAALLAMLMSYADGFWLTSLQGAVGAIERAQRPFETWLQSSTLMVPVFGVAVLAALMRARRRLGPEIRTPRVVMATAMLIVAAGTAVGVGETAASSLYDYHLQAARIHGTASTHGQVIQSSDDAAVGDHAVVNCDRSCLEQRTATMAVHARGVAYASGVLLVTNLVLVAWVVALRGGRLDGW